MIDAVLSYHMNPQTCGVAKFNQQLAQRLGVPMASVHDSQQFSHPLYSVKYSEWSEADAKAYTTWPTKYDVLWHDRHTSQETTNIFAERVFYADEIGCPSTINGNATRGAYRVLVFGMAHKLLLPHFENLKVQLDEAHPDYTIELSTAVHEGSPWDETLTESIASMRAIFHDKLRVLGFLGDDAVAETLRRVDAVACYFVPALRANNTSYWAAVDTGKTIYTNRDEYSPKEGERKTWDELVGLLRA